MLRCEMTALVTFLRERWVWEGGGLGQGTEAVQTRFISAGSESCPLQGTSIFLLKQSGSRYGKETALKKNLRRYIEDCREGLTLTSLMNRMGEFFYPLRHSSTLYLNHLSFCGQTKDGHCLTGCDEKRLFFGGTYRFELFVLVSIAASRQAYWGRSRSEPGISASYPFHLFTCRRLPASVPIKII